MFTTAAERGKAALIAKDRSKRFLGKKSCKSKCQKSRETSSASRDSGVVFTAERQKVGAAHKQRGGWNGGRHNRVINEWDVKTFKYHKTRDTEGRKAGA